ncbi:MAG: hypothetical protein K2X28_01885 [Alphaproteobacteria bacterium]|nr:hypothetical protein [Alphaproteobacteria bacterium]
MVERANQTLQDCLIKEMRLRQISGIEEGNPYLKDFIEQHNKRFAAPAKNAADAQRPLYHKPEDLKRTLSVQSTRKLSKNLELLIRTFLNCVDSII